MRSTRRSPPSTFQASARWRYPSGGQIGDEEGYYEIEVTRDDGSRVDVHLDRGLDVLGKLADHESPDDKDVLKDD